MISALQRLDEMGSEVSDGDVQPDESHTPVAEERSHQTVHQEEDLQPEEDFQPEETLQPEEDLQPEEVLQPEEDLQPEEVIQPEEDLQPEDLQLLEEYDPQLTEEESTLLLHEENPASQATGGSEADSQRDSQVDSQEDLIDMDDRIYGCLIDAEEQHELKRRRLGHCFLLRFP